MRSRETVEINKRLEIVKLGHQRFETKNGYYQPDGYALRHPELGYFAFEGDRSDIPYIPVGGRGALQQILDTGGFLDFDNCKWLKSMP